MIRNLGQVAAIYIGSSQPTNTNLIWLDNTVVPYAFRAYDGSTWSELATRDWVKMFVDGWLVSLPPSTQAGDTDYLLINSNNVNYKITVKEFVKSAVGNPLDFKGVIRTDADFPNPANCEAGDMYVIITSPAGGTVTDPYSGQVFEDTEKIVWDEVTKSWASLGKIEINVDLSTDYSATNVTINSSAGKGTTINAASTSLAGVMLPQQVKFLAYLSNGSTVPGEPSELDPDTPAHKHNYGDILNRLISQQEMGDSTYHPMSQKAVTDNLNLKFDKANVVQVQGAATDMVMSQKAVTDAITTLDEWIKNELTKYLPLAGGNMYGALVMNNNVGVNAKNTLGNTYNLAVLDSNNQVQLGTTSYSTRINSSASDLIHQRSSTQYKIWDSYNLSKPTVYNGGAIGTPTTIYDRNLSVNGTGWTFLSATNAPTTSIFAPTTVGTKGYYLVSSGTGAPVWQQLEDLGDGKYLPLIGGTLTGQVTIQQSVDIKLRLQSTDADNYCIIQAINAQASQLGVFGYAGDKWAIGHNGIYYEIWDKYNLTNPVTYTTNTYNHATLTNKDGQYFTYIKAGTDGLLPHSKATLVSGGSGFLGTSDQSFNAAYINNLHTNKVTFGVNGPYIIGDTSVTQFLDANGGVQKVATGGLYVGVSYASDALNLVPTKGIYSYGNIKSSGWLEFTNNKWTDEGGVYKEATGSLKVLWTDVAGPTQYGSILQINSRLGHWNTQLWIDQTNTSGNNGKLRYRSTKVFSSVEWNDWTTIATEPYVSSNYLPLTGGTLSGNLTINTVGSTTFVINNNDTNRSETFMRVLRKGTASAAIGFRDSLGAYIYNYNSKKYLFIDNDGYARVGTTSGSTRLALITDIPTVSGYLPLSGGTLTGALTMRSRRNNVVVDVVGGAGNIWDEGAGALSIQVPNDSGQTPLILARRSGAAINTTVATERLLSMELLDTGHSFIIGMSGSEALQLDWTSGKAGTGKLFGKTIATTDQIPSLNGYATQSWANGQFAPLKNYFVTSNYASIATTGNEMCIGSLTSGNSIINVNYRNGTGTTSPSTWYWRAGSSTTWANAYWGNLYMNNNLVATQTWSNSQYPLKTGAGASGTWDINISGNASTASAASKLGSTTIGGSAKPIYLSSGTPTACSATIGSATVPVYMNAGTITQCSTTLGVSITGNAATATNATQLGGTAASSYVKANDNISRLTNDSGYATQEWVNSQNFVKSTSTKKVTDIQVVDALPATQASGVLYLVVK